VHFSLQVVRAESQVSLQESLSHFFSHASLVLEQLLRHVDAVSVQAHGVEAPASPTTRVSVPTMSEQPHRQTRPKTRKEFTTAVWTCAAKNELGT